MIKKRVRDYINLKRDLILGAASLALIGSLFLPNVVAGVNDSNKLNNTIMVDSQRISFDTAPELSLPDRIALISNSGAEVMPLNSGNVMDEETASGRAISELEVFFRGGPYTFGFRSCKAEECVAAFVINMNDPSVNMIVWELMLTDAQENTALVTIDDETGVILKIILKPATRNQNSNAASNSQQQGLTDARLYSDAEALSGLMKTYYGLNIILGDYHYSGSFSYYRADLSDSGKVIPMFGVVRSAGFTMNERVPRG